jgi:predicted transcriptional regulator
MKYRSRSDIIGLLLNAANGGGATKMKLMYKAYLSFNQLKEYLTFVAEKNFYNSLFSKCFVGHFLVEFYFFLFEVTTD